jgi:hypothetical protein
MAVHQTADKITAITTAATPETDVAGMEIHKDMLKQQNADGKAVDMALPEAVMKIMMTGGTAVLPETVITIMKMTTEEMGVAIVALKDTTLHTVTMKIVAQIHVAVVTTMMMTIEDMDKGDGLAILKDIQRLLNADGKTEEVTIAAAITTEVTVIVVTAAVTVVIMTIVLVMAEAVVGMVIQKGMLKQPTKVGETADIKLNCKKNRPDAGRFFYAVHNSNN